MPINSFLKDYADKYDEFYKDKDYKKETEELDKVFKEHNVKTVLDVACGTGNHMLSLQELGYTVKGSDISPSMVKIAKNKELDVSVCAMQDLIYENEFDAVICMFAAFDYIIEKYEARKAINAIHKALKPKGIFIFDFWNKKVVEKEYRPVSKGRGKISFTDLSGDIARITIYFNNRNEIHFLRYYDPKEIEGLLSKFTDIQMKPINNRWSMQVICSKPQ